MKKHIIGILVLGLMTSAAEAEASYDIDEQAYMEKLRASFKQQGITLTPEQEDRLLQQQRTIKARFGMPANHGQDTRPAQHSPAKPVTASESEESLGARIATFPSRPEVMTLEDRKDGFTANGRAYIDPEGVIRNYAINVLNGLATYMAETGNNTFSVKVIRAGTNVPPVSIATAVHTGNGWRVDTASGKSVTGQRLSMLSNGFLVTRDAAAFIYTPGQGLRNVAVPNGFVVANFQRGDVQATDYLLLERERNTSNNVGGLFTSLNSLGASLGMTTQEDYVLFNVSTNDIVPINISASGKRVAEHSGCRRKNSVINECSRVDFREALYTDTGRNIGHYFWRINWFETTNGPILVALENSLKNVVIRDLKTGKKMIAFSRTLGINGFDAIQKTDGKIRITANMGFSTETIEDAAIVLASDTDVHEAKEKAQSQDDKNVQSGSVN